MFTVFHYWQMEPIPAGSWVFRYRPRSVWLLLLCEVWQVRVFYVHSMPPPPKVLSLRVPGFCFACLFVCGMTYLERLNPSHRSVLCPRPALFSVCFIKKTHGERLLTQAKIPRFLFDPVVAGGGDAAAASFHPPSPSFLSPTSSWSSGGSWWDIPASI